jgi:hypothetical protein
VNYYPEQLRVILLYIEALNEAEEKINKINYFYPPYAKSINLTDEGGADFGELRDEIGGSWSWTPAEGKK